MKPRQELCTMRHQLILSLAMTQTSTLRLQLLEVCTAKCKHIPICHLLPFCSATQNSHLFLPLQKQVISIMLAITCICQLLFPSSLIPLSGIARPTKQSLFPNSLHPQLSHNLHPPRISLSPVSLHPPLSYNLWLPLPPTSLHPPLSYNLRLPLPPTSIPGKTSVI